MTLPISLALLVYYVGRKNGGSALGGWRGRAAFFATFRGHTAFLYSMFSLLLLVGLIFTQSRTGIALAFLGVLLVTFMLSWRVSGGNVRAPVKTVVLLALGIGVAIGLVPVIDRFASTDPLQYLRWTIFSATLHGIGALFPFGSGPGSYEEAFPAFQSMELGRWDIDYAHNDYLQWLFEGGLFSGALVLLLVVLYLLQWRRVFSGGEWSRFRFVQVGAGVGVFLLLLHELVDYNLLIPANSLYFSFLAGVFFADSDTELSTSRRKRMRRTPDLVSSSPQDMQLGVATIREEPEKQSADRTKHPFAD